MGRISRAFVRDIESVDDPREVLDRVRKVGDLKSRFFRMEVTGELIGPASKGSIAARQLNSLNSALRRLERRYLQLTGKNLPAGN